MLISDRILDIGMFHLYELISHVSGDLLFVLLCNDNLDMGMLYLYELI